MESNLELQNFATQLREEISARTAEQGSLHAKVFTEYLIEALEEAGELEEGEACYHKARGVEVSGYALDDEGTLHLFNTIYMRAPSPQTVARSDVETCFKRLISFFQRVLSGYHHTLEEASKAFDMAEHIYSHRDEITKIRLYLFTDGFITVGNIPDTEVNGLPVSHRVWDLLHLYRFENSGKTLQPIHIDFVERFGQPLPCLRGTDDSADYDAYLTVLPGDVLNDIYTSYGPRLLELNVRTYLQAKGKVNQGIRNTILKEPKRFLAYNNGISATATRIEVVTIPGGGIGIKSLDDLQIVNGGQTTASLFHTARKDRADLTSVRVQAKISVVTSENITTLVPLISRYANSQNKVAEADFSANDPFHVQLETFSRSIWAPAVGGNQHQTRWFYERARGQYQDALNREGTAARQKQFKDNHPTTQKFTKTDLAKFEMTWEQFPHIVSLGAQKCFVQFSQRLQKKRTPDIDQVYFQRLIAKAILFRQAEKIVALHNFGGYRANVVTYTLAYILYHTAGRVDLERIWLQQQIGPGIQSAIEHVSRKIHGIILSPPGEKNVTEWCKRAECWMAIQNSRIELPSALDMDLLTDGYNEKVSRRDHLEASPSY